MNGQASILKSADQILEDLFSTLKELKSAKKKKTKKSQESDSDETSEYSKYIVRFLFNVNWLEVPKKCRSYAPLGVCLDRLCVRPYQGEC